MKTMIQFKRGFLPLILLFLSAVAVASPEARFNLLKVDYKLNEDGSQEFHFRKELTIYTHPAMNNTYGETFIVYNPDYQTLTINESYTRQSDGTIIQNPKNAFVKQLPSAAARAPYYNHITEMAVVHTGLDLGCTLYLDYTIKSKAGFLPALDVCLPIAERAPIDRCELTISLPDTQTLHFQDYGTFKLSKKEQEGNYNVYSWVLENVPEVLPELYAPVSTLLMASTWKDNDAVATYVGKQFDQAALTQVPAELKTALDTCNGNRARIDAIVAYVQTHVESIGLSYHDCGYRIRPCQDVLASAYGTEAEKAALLYSLLKSCGMTPVLTLESPSLPTAVVGKTPSLAIESDFSIRLKEGNELLEIAPATGNIAPVLAEATGIQLLQYPLGAELKAPASAPAYHKEYQLTLAADGTLTAEGDMPPVRTDTTASYRLLSLGLPADAASAQLPLFASQRTYPVVLPTAIDETITYTLALPAGTKLCNPGEKAKVTNSVGSVEISIEGSGSQAVVRRSLKITATEIPAKQYSKLSELLSLWHDKQLTTLLLAR